MPDSRRISLAHLLLLLPWIAVSAKAFKSVTDNSYLWHIQAGHLQRASGGALIADPFSFTMVGEPWLTQSWLAELAYSVAHDTFGIGFTGAMVMLAAAVAIVGLGIISFAEARSVPATAVCVVLGTLMMLSYLVPRPALFSLPLFVLVIICWGRTELRWALPFLMWTWASVHGSFVLGLGYTGIMLVARKDWKAWPVAIVSGLVTLLTAHGFGTVTILADFASARPYLDLMTEWRAPDFLTADLFPFLLGLGILGYGAFKRRLALIDLWVIAPFVLFAFSASRSVALAWIALSPLIARSIRGMEWKWSRGFPAGVAVATGAVVLVLPVLFVQEVRVDPTHFPLAASDQLEDVHTFHDASAGGFLIYAEALDDGVFIDDRAELYRERVQEFVDVRALREPWEPVFERDQIEQVLLRLTEPLVGSLKDSGWKIVFEDDNFVVLRPS